MEALMDAQDGKEKCKIGMIGLGVMGRNLLLNMADNGFTVAGYDKDQEKVESLRKESNEKNVFAASTLEEFISLLEKPRAIMLLVPAGKPVDAVIDEFVPHLEAKDLIIDAGNSHFTDTNRHLEKLKEKNIGFLGVGVSGGEEGARHGPSIMPGGPKDDYERVREILEAASAKVNNEPCVTYLGEGSAGHYVKMVHNGIEYAIMQMICETYDLMKRGLDLGNEQLAEVYTSWNQSELDSYLVEITAHIFSKKDDKKDGFLIDIIRDVAKQKGTGQWTSQSAMELQVPTPTIDYAVSMRDLSMFVQNREEAKTLYKRSIQTLKVEDKEFTEQLKSALLVGMIAAYAQGMALLSVASEKYNYNLDLESVAKIWRGGCIIRAKLLEDIRSAFRKNAKLSNLILDPGFFEKIKTHEQSLRKTIACASTIGVPSPCLMATLSYLDACTSGWLPANLIQAQRDYFGSHTYERLDEEGTFHTQWT